MEGERGANPSRLGLITDPDFPQLVADNLADELPNHLVGDQGWVVEVEVDPITAGRHGPGEILQAARTGWNITAGTTRSA